MGVSPIACGAPAGKEKAFILDMAPSVAARGKIYKAKRRGEKIPTDWALDAEGRQTNDPAAALGGVMLPMGGPKGSALSVMMDVFSGVFSGSAFAGHCHEPVRPEQARGRGSLLGGDQARFVHESGGLQGEDGLPVPARSGLREDGGGRSEFTSRARSSS